MSKCHFVVRQDEVQSNTSYGGLSKHLHLNVTKSSGKFKPLPIVHQYDSSPKTSNLCCSRKGRCKYKHFYFTLFSVIMLDSFPFFNYYTAFNERKVLI